MPASKNIVYTRVPTRIDLAGGTLDLWPLHHILNDAVTVNAGITVFARCRAEITSEPVYHLKSSDQKLSCEVPWEGLTTSPLPLIGLIVEALWDPRWGGLSLQTDSESPAGAGLGGSSCLGIAIAAAIDRLRSGDCPRLAERELVELVQNIEAKLIHAPTGTQDHWGGVRGNVNIIRYPFSGPVVESLNTSPLTKLSEQLIVCYSGQSRQSSLNNWAVFRGVFDGDTKLIAALQEICLSAAACAAAIKDGNSDEIIRHSREEWQTRTRLWPDIETSVTKKIDRAARDAGAVFTRVCGAGGGGVMIAFGARDRHDDIRAAMTAAGGTVIAAGLASKGLTVGEQPL